MRGWVQGTGKLMTGEKLSELGRETRILKHNKIAEGRFQVPARKAKMK